MYGIYSRVFVLSAPRKREDRARKGSQMQPCLVSDLVFNVSAHFFSVLQRKNRKMRYMIQSLGHLNDSNQGFSTSDYCYYCIVCLNNDIKFTGKWFGPIAFINDVVKSEARIFRSDENTRVKRCNYMARELRKIFATSQLDLWDPSSRLPRRSPSFLRVLRADAAKAALAELRLCSPLIKHVLNPRRVDCIPITIGKRTRCARVRWTKMRVRAIEKWWLLNLGETCQERKSELLSRKRKLNRAKRFVFFSICYLDKYLYDAAYLVSTTSIVIWIRRQMWIAFVYQEFPRTSNYRSYLTQDYVTSNRPARQLIFMTL